MDIETMTDEAIDTFVKERKNRIAFDQLKTAIKEGRVNWTRIDSHDRHAIYYMVCVLKE